MILTLDLHVHSDASHDGRLTPAQIIDRARAAGLDGVAICDHDTFPDLTGVQVPADFLLIPGVEISTDLGHILGLLYDVPPELPQNRSAVDAIDAIHAAGGLAVLAHPFQHSRDEERLTPLIGTLDGVEVFNARAARKNKDANDLAEAFCRKHAHLFQQIRDPHTLTSKILRCYSISPRFRWRTGLILLPPYILLFPD